MDFDQACTDTLLGGGKEVIRFWWPWPHFQGHTNTLKFSNFDQRKLPCTLSLEPNDGFWPNFMYCIIGIIKRIGVRIASCLHSTSWTNGFWPKLAQTQYWDEGKKWLDFGDLDLIFKVTPTLWNFQILTKESFPAPYLLNQMMDSGQTLCIVSLG